MTCDPDRPPGASEDVSAEKKRLRQTARAARRQAAATDRIAGGMAAAALRDRVLARRWVEAGSRVSGYWPMGDEIDPRPLLTALAERGCRLALPALRGPGAALDFRSWLPGDALVAAAFGTQEPAAGQASVEPQILLVPLLAFDARGYRLGYGGGFYDRSLAGLRRRGDILAIGLAYAGQQVDRVPHDDNDQRLDWVVTDQAVIKPQGRPGSDGCRAPRSGD